MALVSNRSNASRHLGAVPLAGATVAALFYGMSQMVPTPKAILEPPSEPPISITITDFAVPEPRQVNRATPPPEIAEEPNALLPVPRTEVVPTPRIGPNPLLDPPGRETGPELGGESQTLLPVVKVAPDYPQRCAQRGIQGEVLLAFDVTKAGTIDNIRVLDPGPGNGCLVRAAINAAARFKYRPQIVNGQAVRVEGLQHAIVFELQ